VMRGPPSRGVGRLHGRPLAKHLISIKKQQIEARMLVECILID
jgi:hypothetical protein